MRAMALGMFIFFAAIGIATFIESDYGTQASKIWVYNALWFEILLAFLAVNLIANIVRYKMWMREKIATLSFHLSFIIIILGAGITRYTGFEGVMQIREGASSNTIYSADPYVWLRVNDGKMQFTYNERMYMAEGAFNDFSIPIDFPGHNSEVTIDYVDFKAKQIDSLVMNDSIKSKALVLVTDGMKNNYLTPGEVFPLSVSQVAFGDQKVNGINIIEKKDSLFIKPTIPIRYIPMSQLQQIRQMGGTPNDSMYTNVAANQVVPFLTTTLYIVAGEQFVFKQVLPNAKRMLMPSGKKNVGLDYLTVRVSDGKESKIITLEGGMGAKPKSEFFQLNGLNYHLEYGSKQIPVPFYLKCDDFMMERYPGSDVASSYASDLQILDTANKHFSKKRVFMNHVMDYNGYRFFQSAYDPDEKGTILSVNHDYWGTTVTYIGYLLMAIGMIMSLFAPQGRFRFLIQKLRQSRENRISQLMKTVVVLLISQLIFASAYAEHNHDQNGHDHSTHKPARKPKGRIMPVEHSEELASLLVQDFDGRIVPMHTVCDQLLRKLYRNNKFEGYNAVQVIMSMQMYPEFWFEKKIIQVPAALREKYSLESYASFKDLSDDQFQFKWLVDYNTALQKREAQRSETEKKLIKLLEKHQVFSGVVQWYNMKWLPVKKDVGNTWYVPLSQESIAKDTVSYRLVLAYLASVDSVSQNPKYIKATNNLNELKAFQRETAPAKILPSESHVNVEISYNKMQIFKNTENGYLLIALVLLILYFVQLLKRPTLRSEKVIKRIRTIFIGLLVVFFVYHGAGLGMRWYISGHAPWSNGYEAVVFIAWITMIAGFIFSRSNPAIIAGTALLAFFMIFVTEMNLLDPEITPLQPVLKSYWLMIHVAIITGSYGFLGLAAILGIINMILFSSRTQKNASVFTPNINELTYVSEMTMTIGLFMLTVGTFLGGIWANESWGRYWGWDPKETWALVSVLVYAIVLHLRYIPGLSGKFLFNAVSMWAYSAILFTFFGVNFILVGLHSYANGDGAVGLPPSVILTIVLFIAFTAFAAWRNAKYNKQIRS